MHGSEGGGVAIVLCCGFAKHESKQERMPYDNIIVQGVEYNVSSFTISDGIFGSCFFFGTGFHGLHVIIGTAFIAVGLWRVLAYHSTGDHHVGLEASILYWHFVDVVWLFLYVSIYYWGS